MQETFDNQIDNAAAAELLANPTCVGADANTNVRTQPLPYRFIKRTFDIVFSSAVIVVGFVPALILSIAIVIDSPGASPIYSQTRLGRGEKPFKMYKFRSMIPSADELLPNLKDKNEATGPLFKIKDDPRVTRVGHFIRKHSIDELPQFLNVFLGQLSCVGPRPPLPSEVAEYTERDRLRLTVKPGLSGYWQISGRSDLTFNDMVNLDIDYINDASPITDLKIIGKTALIMVKGDGAY
ncbi:sugar transferase [Adlercreutzia sp. ZJ304]|uniref:sugar transferase n=1 Tax=Adlercreutzia sp. ZJ304 TaxID=2709791 RepID=UPI001F1551D4|nr:sugar transferase [Adlercreutzia sp. ZJ304]